MSNTREKAEGFTKQVIGQMIGDELLVEEGKEQQSEGKEQRESAEKQGEAPSPAEPSRARPAERRNH